jgi:hypothetical protein
MVARSRSSNKDSCRLPASARAADRWRPQRGDPVEPGGLENLLDPRLGDHAREADQHDALQRKPLLEFFDLTGETCRQVHRIHVGQIVADEGRPRPLHRKRRFCGPIPNRIDSFTEKNKMGTSRSLRRSCGWPWPARPPLLPSCAAGWSGWKPMAGRSRLFFLLASMQSTVPCRKAASRLGHLHEVIEAGAARRADLRPAFVRAHPGKEAPRRCHPRTQADGTAAAVADGSAQSQRRRTLTWSARNARARRHSAHGQVHRIGPGAVSKASGGSSARCAPP